SLTAQFKDDAVQLFWQTGAESDVRGFLVERMDKSSDSTRTVAMIPPQRTGAYSLIDREVQRGVTYTYRLSAVNAAARAAEIGAIAIRTPLPRTILLAQNYPNPFNPNTTIHYILPAAQSVVLALYDVNGKHVRLLADGQQEAGEHSVTWDGKDDAGHQLPSGLYVCRLTGAGESLSKKMTLLK
ncbi:T9SS C-terminal target domain-containing protein, partial [candidate division KSB1 bacterium]